MTDAAASKSTAAVAIAAIVLPEMLLRKLVVPSGCTRDIGNFVALLHLAIFDSSIVILNYNVLAFFRHVINCQDLPILDKRSTSFGVAENVVDVEKWRPKNNSWVYSTVGSINFFVLNFLERGLSRSYW